MQRFHWISSAFSLILIGGVSGSCSGRAGSFSAQTSLGLDSCPVSAEKVLEETPLGPMRVSLSAARANYGHYALDLRLQGCSANTAQVLQVRSTIRCPMQKRQLSCSTGTFVVSQSMPHMTFPNIVARNSLDRLVASSTGGPFRLQVDLQVRQLSGLSRSLISKVLGGNNDDYQPSGGLRNLRNTCYLNSALQLLYSVPAVRSAIQNTDYLDGSAGASLKSLFKTLSTAVGDPSTLAKQMNINVMVQEDAHEFLLTLFSALQESHCNGVGAASIEDMYAGEFCTITTSRSPSGNKCRRERFVGVSLDVEGIPSVLAALQQFTATQELKNGADPNAINIQPLTTRSTFSRLPRVLLLQLKRFAYDSESGNVVKLGHEMDVPLELDMSPYMTDSIEHGNGSQPQQRYLLQSAVIHTGEAQVGHYYIYVRPDPHNRPSLWLKYDDTNVQRVSWEQVEREIRGIQYPSRQQLYPGQPKSTTAYLVQYVRHDDDEIPLPVGAPQ